MALIAIYILTAVLVLLNIEPLKIAAVFFGICYLPGLSLLTYGKRGRLAFEDFILAFPCSIGVSSILILGLLFMGIHVKYIPYIIYMLTGVIVLFYVKKNEVMKLNLTSNELVFFFFAFLITLLFSIPVLLGADRVAISSHGFFHSTLATQILNGIFPPENPGMGGARLSYHWGYHALVATLSATTDFHPLRVFSTLNILSMFFIFCFAYQTAKFFGFSEEYRYLLPLGLIGLMRLDAGIFFIYKLLSGNLDFINIANAFPGNIYLSWASGVSYLDSRLFFINKFYNANSMPLGILLIFSYFLAVLILSEKRLRDKKVYIAILSFTLMAIAINYPILLIIPVLHMPLWMLFIFLSKEGNYKEKIKKVGELLLPCIIAVIITVPYLVYVSSGETMNVGKTPGDPAKVAALYKMQIIKNLIIFWLPLPLIIAGIWVALKKRLGFSRKMFFISWGALVCLLLADFLRLPWYNSYKFSFILSFFFALFFIFSLQGLMSLISNRWLKGFTVFCVIFFLILTPVMTELAYIVSPWFHDNTYAFSGNHIIFKKNRDKNEAYSWIRNNTSKNSLILLPYLSLPYPYWDDPANNFTYRTAAISERAFFVIKDVYVWTTKGYEERVKIREKIFENPNSPQVRDFLNSLNRPIYLLVEDDLPSILLKDERFNQFQENLDNMFLLKFHNARQRVYLIKS